MMKRFLISLAGLSLVACGASEEAQHSGHDMTSEPHVAFGTAEGDGPVARQVTAIDVRASWMRPHPGGRDVTAAYVVVNLSEGSEDLLTGARIEGAERVELHGHIIGNDGVMQMREIGPQRVTDQGPLVFTPGARHLMVFGLATVTEGDEVGGVLEFQNAGDVAVTFEVRSMPPGQVTDY